MVNRLIDAVLVGKSLMIPYLNIEISAKGPITSTLGPIGLASHPVLLRKQNNLIYSYYVHEYTNLLSFKLLLWA